MPNFCDKCEGFRLRASGCPFGKGSPYSGGDPTGPAFAADRNRTPTTESQQKATQKNGSVPGFATRLPRLEHLLAPKISPLRCCTAEVPCQSSFSLRRFFLLGFPEFSKTRPTAQSEFAQTVFGVVGLCCPSLLLRFSLSLIKHPPFFRLPPGPWTEVWHSLGKRLRQ